MDELDKSHAKAAAIIGWLLLICGLASLVCGSIWTSLGGFGIHGIWSAILLMVTAILGIVMWWKRAKGIMIGFLVMCILTIITSSIQCIYSGELHRTFEHYASCSITFGVCHCYSRSTGSYSQISNVSVCKSWNAVVGSLLTITIANAIATIIALIGSIFGCVALCNCGGTQSSDATVQQATVVNAVGYVGPAAVSYQPAQQQVVYAQQPIQQQQVYQQQQPMQQLSFTSVQPQQQQVVSYQQPTSPGPPPEYTPLQPQQQQQQQLQQQQQPQPSAPQQAVVLQQPQQQAVVSQYTTVTQPVSPSYQSQQIFVSSSPPPLQQPSQTVMLVQSPSVVPSGGTVITNQQPQTVVAQPERRRSSAATSIASSLTTAAVRGLVSGAISGFGGDEES